MKVRVRQQKDIVWQMKDILVGANDLRVGEFRQG